jgi:hypothetical protein
LLFYPDFIFFSSTFVSQPALNLLAFLFHTVLHLTDLAYQQIRHQRGTRKGFFQDLLSLTKYLLFESWSSLINFMLYGSPPNPADNSS